MNEIPLSTTGFIIGEPKPIGRPTIFTKELADQICEQLAMGKSMRTVCRDERMPAMSTIFSWLRTNEDFLEQYARAKEESADALVDEMIEIADDGSNDLMTITKGRTDYEVENKEVTNRSKLRVDTRKWIASKLKPKRYGDKLDLTSGGRAIKSPAIISVVKARHVEPQGEAAASNPSTQ